MGNSQINTASAKILLSLIVAFVGGVRTAKAEDYTDLETEVTYDDGQSDQQSDLRAPPPAGPGSSGLNGYVASAEIVGVRRFDWAQLSYQMGRLTSVLPYLRWAGVALYPSVRSEALGILTANSYEFAAALNADTMIVSMMESNKMLGIPVSDLDLRTIKADLGQLLIAMNDTQREAGLLNAQFNQGLIGLFYASDFQNLALVQDRIDRQIVAIVQLIHRANAIKP